MRKIALPATFVLLLVSPAHADTLYPMDVMGPFDTPASVAERIVQPLPSRDIGRYRGGGVGLENAGSRPAAIPETLVDLGGGGPRDRLLDEVASGRKERKRDGKD